MNREDIIAMAREAGFDLDGMANMLYTVRGNYAQLERFAALVAAAAVASERDSWPAEMEAMERQVNILTDELANARAAEREECAKECDKPWNVYALQAAIAIRARGNT